MIPNKFFRFPHLIVEFTSVLFWIFIFLLLNNFHLIISMSMRYFVKIKSSYASFITMDNTGKLLSSIVWLLLSSANSISNAVTFSHPLGFSQLLPVRGWLPKKIILIPKWLLNMRLQGFFCFLPPLSSIMVEYIR